MTAWGFLAVRRLTIRNGRPIRSCGQQRYESVSPNAAISADYDEHREEYDYARDAAVSELHIWEPPHQETDDEILNDVTDENARLDSA